MGLDCVVCIGGNGTQKTAAKLSAMGLNIVSVPKTIDNDIWGTDFSFGFDSAVSIATDAIDRLHSTASSHKRVMVIEVMGHKAGWIALYLSLIHIFMICCRSTRWLRHCLRIRPYSVTLPDLCSTT